VKDVALQLIRIFSTKERPLTCIGHVEVDLNAKTLLFAQSASSEQSQDIRILSEAGIMPLLPSVDGYYTIQHSALGRIVLKRNFIWVYKDGEHWRIIVNKGATPPYLRLEFPQLT
jgi:hypothetical protein